MQRKHFNFTSNSKTFRNFYISKCLLKKALMPPQALKSLGRHKLFQSYFYEMTYASPLQRGGQRHDLCPHLICMGFYPPLGDNTNKAGLSPALLKANRNNSHPPL